jgi:hypothetical protein
MSELLNLVEYKQQLTEQISNLDLSDYELPNEFKRQFHNFGEYKIEEYYKYTIKVRSKKSVCYIPNQWVFIAAICSKYCIELKKYKQKLQSLGVTDDDFESCHPSTSDKSIPEEHRKDEYVSKKAKDLLSSYSGDDKDLLISFLWDYDSWGGGKNIKRDNDFTISPCLNVANSINASSSLIGDLAKAIGDDMNLYLSLMNSAEMDRIRKGVQIVKNELVREKSAASFLKTAMKTTLDLDNNFSGLEKTGKYKVTKKNLKIDGFWFGRDKDQPPTRESDIYPDVTWTFNSKNYVLNVEITPKDMEDIFFPIYNDAYQKQLYMEKDLNGDYVLYEFLKSQRHVNSLNTHPLQQIFYGAPGTGKSHEVNELTKGCSVIRTTFHPDSDYSTFVGAYKPSTEEAEVRVVPVVVNNGISLDQNKGTYKEKKIVYKFVKQAFLKAYLLAWKKMCDNNCKPLASNCSSTSLITNIKGQATTPYEKTGNPGNNTSFVYTTENGATLTPDEETLLNNVDNFDFPFDGIASFGELHKNIKVVVTDAPTPKQQQRYKKSVTISAELIREIYQRWSDRETPNHDERGALEKIISLILHALETDWMHLDKLKDYQGPSITIEVDDNTSTSLLGLYESSTKTIYLFKNNIGNDETLLSATYIHEMFHAYYDSKGLYIPEIEEPIVECNTLCFLELFETKYYHNYKLSVNDKKSCLAINYYGFGSFLYENCSLDWMRLYRNSIGKIDKNSSLVKQYQNIFANIYPFGKEQETLNILYAILDPRSANLSYSNTITNQFNQFLIIEEINRGNCAQIFGDIFQLLDRQQENGFSTYPIEADTDIQQAIETAFKEEEPYKLMSDIAVDGAVKDYTSNYGATLSKDIQEGRILLLPPNLYIWATMNTSDQSLFPIDSAFKRRWEWKYVPIDTKKEEWYILVNKHKYSWTSFLDIINDTVLTDETAEDKHLGFYFCKAEKNIISAEKFVGKVLFYLWNDVFKVYGVPSQITNGSKEMTYPKFYNPDGSINEDRVEKLLDNLKVENDKKKEDEASDETESNS